MNTVQLLSVARGEQPADRLLKNGKIVNVFSGEIEEASIALYDNVIAGVGDAYQAREEIDLDGSYVAPGLVDAHVHIESSLSIPSQFAAAVLPRGVTCVVTDPHEIANVVGTEGIRYMSQSSQGLPLSIMIMAPSCVPATHMETNGAHLDDEDLIPLLQDGTVFGLAEMMNYPGVVQGTSEVIAKLSAFQGRPLDGHAPGLRGKPLNAYAAAGIGSEHECTTVEEAAEKLARGFYILIREATNARNLHALLPLITPENSRRICFCTDDRIPGDLIDQGSIDYMVRAAILFGIDPITAFRMATLNSADWFGLHKHGAIAPGRYANFFTFDDLRCPIVRDVYAQGKLVAKDGTSLSDELAHAQKDAMIQVPQAIQQTVRINTQGVDLKIPIPHQGVSQQIENTSAVTQIAIRATIRVIGAIEDQLLTEERILPAKVVEGYAIADTERDILKMAVVERHTPKSAGTVNGVGLGFIQGFGLQRGAMASTVAHDHHNLVVIGADDDSMHRAIKQIVVMGGGVVVAEGDTILAELPLPVAGLMSDRPIEEVRVAYDQVRSVVHLLGSSLHDPLMAMSFMALEVIPKLKLTDKGLVDVEKFEIVDLFL
ncbi:MAG: adenine deaminase [Chloroflexota bacterium]